MGYLDQEKKSTLEQKVFKNQVCLIICIFLYIMGIITLIFILPESHKLDVLDIIAAAIAPISAIGWFYFTRVLYNLKASVYNRFGSGHLYRQIFLVWGNKKLSIVALIFSLVITSLSFFNIIEQKEFNELRRELVRLQNNLAKTYKNLGLIRKSIDDLEKQTSEGLKIDKKTSEELKIEVLERKRRLTKAIYEIDYLRKELGETLDISPKIPMLKVRSEQ